jgi:bifunctional non-homologous end joining protein LigD
MAFDQWRAPVASTRQLPVCAFVLLRLDGDDLRQLPLSDRKAKLRKLLARARDVWHVEADGDDSFKAACELGLEGIVSKRLTAPYKSGPCKS